MKIGLDTAPAALRGTYFQHLASVLARYAPEHEYVIGAEVNDGVDLYHGFRSSLPLSVHLRRVPSVMTVPNLNLDRKSTRLNSSHSRASRMPSSA